MAGVLDDSADRRLVDRDAMSLDSARTGAGFTDPLSAVRLQSGAYSAFIELHIEQGPLLEERKVDLGVVTAIAAPATLRLWIEGQGGHAGAVLMPQRRDAFLAAAEIALAVEAAARSTGAPDTVATTGVCDVFPGAVNSIPSRVRLEIDVRDVDQARRDSVLQKISESAQAVSTRRQVTARSETLNADAPAQCASAIVAALVQACETHGFSSDFMISRAYHDCLFMSRICPAAMLFIPCRAGISHHPDEYASPEAIARGALVLAEVLVTLSNGKIGFA
jgi:N-carbamoyl-L-amino-acid hydrolase